MRRIGLDIGGANLKASDGERRSLCRNFAMWERVAELPQVLSDLLAEFGSCDAVAVTMTAELADYFPSKAEGVDRVLASVEVATSVPVHVWQTAGEFVTVEVAREFPRLTAAANWHALATWAGRMSPHGVALLVDVGSTTTDIIPLRDGMPLSVGLTDVERLLSGELVYSGVRRTPVCAVVKSVPLRDVACPIAAEMFATMDDVYIILGDIPEDADRLDTADGRPATRTNALNRLAHMLCCDRSELNDAELILVAEHIRAAQRDDVLAALSRVIGRTSALPAMILVAGEGEFLAVEVIKRLWTSEACEVISLTESLGSEHSHAACAYALARLSCERVR